MRVLVVRHAHAGVRGTWPGSDLERPLSDRGRAQTAALTAWLRDQAPASVVSSEAVRCVDTVVPAADELGLTVTTSPALLEGAPPEESLALLSEERDGPAVACTHGDVIRRVLELLAEGDVPLGEVRRWPKGSVWELDVADGRVTAGRLLRTPDA